MGQFLVRVVIATSMALLVVGCSTLTPLDLPDELTPEPSRAEVWKALDADHQDDWFVLLNDGNSALEWRLLAIDTATESIDLQTFLWKFDTAGSRVLARLIAAADRGVRVRLLVDDALQAGHDAELLALQHHPNIEYHIYNPFKRRASGAVLRWAINLAEFGRLDHRMHNKAMVIDNRVAIIGGRNLADAYFGFDDAANFRDMELLVGGPIVRRIATTFDAYWNDRWSIPIDRLARYETGMVDLVSVREKLEAVVSGDPTEDEGQRLERWRKAVGEARRGRAELLVDRPPDGNPALPDEAPVQLADALVGLFDSAREEVLIVSAYLIPTERLETIVGLAVDRGVRIRILTNSIASNNHLAAHSAYRNHIHRLLGEGADIHEVRTDASNRDLYMLSPVETKALALHAKALVIDDDRVFVGSANLDPRSLRLNTEMGLLVTSPELNEDIRSAIEPDFSTLNAWRLQFDDNGGIVWMSEDGVLTVQPATSFMQRIEDWFLSTLPIEAEL